MRLAAFGSARMTLVTADMNGNYRVTLPPGNYVLDVQGRARTRAREAATLHRCLESHPPRRYGYRHRHSLSGVLIYFSILRSSRSVKKSQRFPRRFGNLTTRFNL